MTVIAYRSGVLACDSAWSSYGLVLTRQNKIVRLDSGALYGAAGDCDDRALLRILTKVKRAEELPSRAALVEIPNEIGALLILANGHLYSVETGKDEAGIYRIRAPFAAVGSGRVLAFGAMAAGANARDACAIAAKYDTSCRAPIHTLTLKRPPA